jgi:hypothetical protein
MRHEELMSRCMTWLWIYNILLSFKTMEYYHPMLEEEMRECKFFDL